MWLSKKTLPVLVLVLGFVLIEVICRLHWIESFLFPAPTAVMSAITDNPEQWLRAAFQTFYCSVIGFFMSAVVGLMMALMLSEFVLLRQAFYPYAVLFQTVPIISVAPLLVIWFGFGPPTVIASSFLVSVFPVLANSMLGLSSTDPALLGMFKMLRSTKLQTLFRLKFPMGMPSIFSGLRIAAGLSVIGAVVGEFVAGGGLGSMVDAARTQQRVDRVFAAVLLTTFIGFLIVALVDWVTGYFLKKWHPSAHHYE